MLSVVHSVIFATIICVLYLLVHLYFFFFLHKVPKEQARSTTKTGAHTSTLALANSKIKRVVRTHLSRKKYKRHATMAHTSYTYIVGGRGGGFRVCGDEALSKGGTQE